MLATMKTLIVTLLLVSGVSAMSLEEELRVTYEQKAAIDKLRQRVLPYITENYMKEDLHLVRWLRASNFNLEETQRKVMENIKWRKENKMTTIHQEDFSDIEIDFPHIFTVDKLGQPVYIGYAGLWDLRAATVTGRDRRVVRYMNQKLEQGARMVRELQHQGRNVSHLSLIIDMDGFTLAQHACVACLFRALDFIMIYNNQYTGVAEKILFINTPPTVQVAIDMVKRNVDPETYRIMKFYGRDRRTWEKLLLGFMDADKLPQQLGGKMLPVDKR